MTATVIAAVAVVGLAYSFSMGRTLIDRFEIARAALGSAQERMASLSVLAPSDTALTIGTHMSGFVRDGQMIGTQRWTVQFMDDPADLQGVDDLDSHTDELLAVAVQVFWRSGGFDDTVHIERVLPIQ